MISLYPDAGALIGTLTVFVGLVIHLRQAHFCGALVAQAARPATNYLNAAMDEDFGRTLKLVTG
jgi:hypothetical protein